MNQNLKIVGLHLFGWVLFFGLIVGFLNRSPEMLSLPGLLESAFLVFFFVYLSLFYLNSYVLIPQLYLKQKYFLYFLVILLLLAGIYWLKPFDQLISLHMRPPDDGPLPPFRRMPPPFEGMRPPRPPRHGGRGRGLDITSIVLFLAVWSFSTALQIMRQWRTTERRALQAEAEKVNAELSFLKAQINPHFLFNTLNNIYSLSITQSEQTPAAILKLSNILHYITDDVRANFVSLQSEVDCVRNYIDLQKLRLTEKVTVQCEVKGTLEGKEIAPLLFMTFIENAFKYGISSHEHCTIRIEITAEEKEIKFFCRNKMVVKSSAEERTGVGINNARKRLEYLYPQKHLLDMHTEEDHFTVHLVIVS